MTTLLACVDEKVIYNDYLYCFLISWKLTLEKILIVYQVTCEPRAEKLIYR